MASKKQAAKSGHECTKFEDTEVVTGGGGFLGDCGPRVTKTFSKCTECGLIHPKKENTNVGN